MKKDSMKRYDAFISYRHTPLDMFVAKTVQKKLEEFKLPKNVKRQQADWERKKIERVFRDQDELPITSDLSDQIYTALTLSDYLIVICTPRIKESIWCQQEIKTFIEMRGYDHVLAVLAEGEPVESFPDELVYRQEYYTDEYGNTTLQTVPVEPLAADVRGKNRKEIKKKIDEEITRLVAPMFSVDYDDLKQRAKERKLKKTLSIAGGIAAAFAVFGLVSGFMALRIIKQNNKIESQSIAIQSQNNEIKEQSNEIGKQQEQLQEQYNKIVYREAQDYGNTALEYLEEGNYEQALNYAYMSVSTDEDGNELPVTNEGINALLNTTYAYQCGRYTTPCMTLEFEHDLVAELISPDRNFILFEDEAGVIKIYDTHTLRLVKEIDSNAEGFLLRKESTITNTTQFLDDETICYETANYFTVYNFVKDEECYSFNFTANNMFTGGLDYVVPSYETNRAVFVCGSNVYLYDYNSKNAELIIDKENGELHMSSFDKPYFTDDQKYLCFRYTDYDASKKMFVTYDLETGEYPYQLGFDKESMGIVFQDRFDGERLYIYGSFGAFSMQYVPSQVKCYDCKTGKELWCSDVQTISYGGITDIFTDTNDENCLVLLDTNILVCMDKETGTITDYEDCPGMIRSYTHYPEYAIMRILTDAGDNHMYYYTSGVVLLVQQKFGKDLSFFEVASQHYYVTGEDLTKVFVWSDHVGNRVNMTGCKPAGNHDLVSTDEKTVFSYNSSGIYANDIATGELLWSLDYDIDKLLYFPNGKLFAFESKAVYVLDALTGEVLFTKEEENSMVLCGYSIQDGYVYYKKLGYSYLMQFDVDQVSEKEFLDTSKIATGAFDSDFRISGDGSHFMFYNANENKYMIYEKGTLKAQIEEYSDNISNVLFVPEHPYIVLEYYNKTIKIYDYEEEKFIYQQKHDYAGSIESVEIGNELFNIILHTTIDDNLFFTENLEYLGTLESIYLRRIVGTQDFVVANEDEIGIVPIYTVDMLKEDAEKLISGEVHLEYEIK